MMKKKLTQSQFNRVTKDTKKEPKTIEMAEAVLVRGESPTNIAKQNYVRRQQVADAANSIYNKYLESQNMPEGWVKVTAVFPPKEARKCLKKSKELLLDYHKNNK